MLTSSTSSKRNHTLPHHRIIPTSSPRTLHTCTPSPAPRTQAHPAITQPPYSSLASSACPMLLTYDSRVSDGKYCRAAPIALTPATPILLPSRLHHKQPTNTHNTPRQPKPSNAATSTTTYRIHHTTPHHSCLTATRRDTLHNITIHHNTSQHHIMPTSSPLTATTAPSYTTL